jgi:hypothetical protein
MIIIDIRIHLLDYFFPFYTNLGEKSRRTVRIKK